MFHVKNCRCLTESFPPATDCWWLDLWSADITAMRNLSQDIQTNVGSVWSGLAWSVVSKQQLLQSLTCFFLGILFLSQLSSNNNIEFSNIILLSLIVSPLAQLCLLLSDLTTDVRKVFSSLTTHNSIGFFSARRTEKDGFTT